LTRLFRAVEHLCFLSHPITVFCLFAPHKEKFFDLFKEAAENALAGAKALHGFATETGAALTIELATRLGIPLSTTHTINTAIIGVGATRRFSAVRWEVTLEIVSAWILTFPILRGDRLASNEDFLAFRLARSQRSSERA
jgi:hypothetical protein